MTAFQILIALKQLCVYLKKWAATAVADMISDNIRVDKIHPF